MKMNKNILLAFGAVAILIVLGGALFVMNKNSTMKPAASSNVANEKPASAQKSLKDLLTAGQSQKCTYTDKIENVDAQGTVYISNGRMRTDMTTQIASKPFISHMIVKDSKAYSWTDGQTMGFMMGFDPNKTPEAAPTGTQSVDVNKFIDYKCSGWAVDEGVFTPPASVKFQEMGSMMSPTGSTGTKTTTPQNNCAVCNYLTGDDKTQCLSSMHCN